MIKIAIGSMLFLASSLALACDYPERPAIPDGATASKEDLLAAKTNVQEFIAKVDEYLTCIETAETAAIAELDNPSQEELQRRDEMLNKKFDAEGGFVLPSASYNPHSAVLGFGHDAHRNGANTEFSGMGGSFPSDYERPVTALPEPFQDRPRHLPHLALRLGDRGGDLLDALPSRGLTKRHWPELG